MLTSITYFIGSGRSRGGPLSVSSACGHFWCSRHIIPLRRMVSIIRIPSILVTPATRVKNGPSLSRASNGSITATPPAARAQRVRFPDAAAVLSLSW